MPPDPIHTLEAARTVAVIGASIRIHRPSHHAVELLLEDGYTVIPVNPKYSTVLDQPCYPDLDDVPNEVVLDIVNVFRRPDAVVDLLNQVADRASRTGRSPVVWTQLGVSTPEARGKAEALDLPYIEERCIMVELERLAGRRSRNKGSRML